MHPRYYEAVGVFDDSHKLDVAVAELEGTAFARTDISVAAVESEPLLEEQKGNALSWMENHAPRGISIRPEEKVIGSGVIIGCAAYVGGCAAALAAKSATNVILLIAILSGSLAGALIGSLIVLAIGLRLQNMIAAQMRKGGLMLWVRTADQNKKDVAQKILQKNGAKYVHIHAA